MKKRLYLLIISLILLAVSACTVPHQENNSSGLSRFMVWDSEASFDSAMTDEDIEEYFKRLTNHNIHTMFLRAGNGFYKRIIPAAQKVGIQIHAWRPTMINSNKEFMKSHKDWYAVNKNNESCVDKPPYVGYYRWFCPNEPAVVEYLINNYLELANIEGIAGVHLDYIRYCDIFLPVGLQPKYNLVQDHEMPEFDYCYCRRCREGFKKEYGHDPLELTDSLGKKQWNEWRLKSIVKIVNIITENVKAKTGKLITAAVFPTPGMSVDMVRQDWGKFEIDAVFPMIYNGFYNKETGWIGKCVKEGIETMEYKKDLYAGLFVHHIEEPDTFIAAVKSALDNGGKGIVFFSARNLTGEHLEIIKDWEE